METIEALKDVLHHEHDESRHPKAQGFALPLVIGIVSYSGILTAGLAGVALLTSLT
ncbi:MAG: hypothetical protein Phyf2KO_22520 [Phycisphaerales bacterium]